MKRFLQEIAIILVVMIAFHNFCFSSFRIEGLSMYPTFHGTEHIVVNRFVYRFWKPERGEVVVIEEPASEAARRTVEKRSWWSQLMGERYIKRVVGVEGDLIAFQDGVLYRNGERVWERQINCCTSRSENPYPNVPEQIIPPGTVYVAGDNRAHSSDSRVFGPVPIDTIVGRAERVIWRPIGKGDLVEPVPGG